MRKLLLTIVVLLLTTPVFAGNKLGTVPVIEQDGSSTGNRADYIQEVDQQITFDPDVHTGLADEVVQDINNVLVDIQLNRIEDAPNYDHALDVISFNGSSEKRFAKNRIYIFAGSGFNSQFFATVRVYNTGEPTCFIGLRKDLWDQAAYGTQKDILLHEIYHCLDWAHPSNNPYVDNFDFVSNDNVEVLNRVHDKNNTKDMVLVTINKEPSDVVGFIAKPKFRTANSTYTVDSEVKLPAGRYKVAVNHRYIRKITKKGKIKYTRKLKKARKFKIGHDNINSFNIKETD